MSISNLSSPYSQITSIAEDFIEHLGDELDVPPSRYEEARNRYQSVGAWLERDESKLREYSPNVYVQGSFRLGTPIRPLVETEDYDIDLVCELNISKSQITQQQLKEMLGHEMTLYAQSHGMKKICQGRRCWTLEYADGAQFHLDALPAVPDAEGQRLILEARALKSEWSDTAIAITDIDHPNYNKLHDKWPHSNPRGYTEWFRSRMRDSFNARRSAMALEAKASVETIPSYRVKTPLQQCVQILKRHRDIMFVDNSDNKPISIIITTLAALSYNNESSVALALQSILRNMDTHIKHDSNGVALIANPTDPTENFADKWPEYPERKRAFFDWLAKARKDFQALASQVDSKLLLETASETIGESIAKKASSRTKRSSSLAALIPRVAAVLNVGHRQAAPWPLVRQDNVSIKNATWTADGFSRPIKFKSDAAPLPKGARLVFTAQTGVPYPYEVYWQVVNTGSEAQAVGGLRGGFDAGSVDRGSIIHVEHTRYAGCHTIECFIVKNNYLVARSGPFIVNIR